MVAQDEPKMSPRWPKMAQDGHKRAPKMGQDRPKLAQDEPKRPQDKKMLLRSGADIAIFPFFAQVLSENAIFDRPKALKIMKINLS